MTRAIRVPSLVVVILGGLAGCTLVLPTEELITPCAASDECEDGFECRENACLPVDEDTEEDEEETEVADAGPGD